MKTVAIIIPVLNEEKAIKKVIKEIPSKVCGLNAESYVIDGGSSDKTCEEVEKTSAEIIHQSYEGGKGSAIREALDTINADAYVFLDGDMTYSPKDMEKLIAPIVESGYKHVTGSRFRDRRAGAFMFRNLFGNFLCSWFFRRLSGSDIKDFLTGYRALSKDLVDELVLESKGFEIETELTFKTLKLGEEIKEVDIIYRARVGKSKLQFLTDGPKILAYAFKISFLDKK